ncbi:dihydrofolate reductase family protein [Nocardioides taihuensis]|uniref:Dihydrofolate reductase family protein n=1 Tax=Nocardioides taihuensis TaxID=1835606 RepID=A0ABW0BFG7_9ACTN
MPDGRPHVVVHVATGLDATVRGFEVDLGDFYALAARFHEDVTLVGADTVLAQEESLASAAPGPGPNPAGPLLAVVDSRRRVSAWDALRDAGYWRDVRALRGQGQERVDLRAALAELAAEGAGVVRVDSGGGLVGALLRLGLVDEVSLVVHPSAGVGGPWTGGAQGLRFELLASEPRDRGLVWLRYAVVAGDPRP